MRKYGLLLHLLITATIGFVFYIIGEVILHFGEDAVWPPLMLAIYFLAFSTMLYGCSYLLCKARGDRKGWYQKNLGNVVTTAFRHAAIGLVAAFFLAGTLEFFYEMDYRKSANVSSYVFLIDDSGSMENTDPQKKRVEAIGAIMEKEKPDFPFAIYRFTHDVEKLRDMAPYRSGETFDFAPTGGTDIVGALDYVVKDIANKKLAAGDSPKILLLSDGESDSAGLDRVLKECIDQRITVSTISYGLGSPLLQEIAGKTGGLYSEVMDSNMLQQEMENAVTHSNIRHLLSNRFVFGNNGLYAAMRILFLILIGLLFSWIKQKCYCSAFDHGFADKVFITSAILCSIGAIMVEVLFAYANLPSEIIRMLFCILWSIIPGFFLQETAFGGEDFASGSATFTTSSSLDGFGKRF